LLEDYADGYEVHVGLKMGTRIILDMGSDRIKILMKQVIDFATFPDQLAVKGFLLLLS
jgi:hypothetical protein